MDTRSINILIIKPSSLGDVLHAFPAVTVLKKHFPNATIDWLVNPEFSKIVEFHKDIDSIIHFPRKELGKLQTFWGAFKKLKQALRKKNYDMVIDFQGLMRSALVSRIVKSTNSYGFKDTKETFASMLYKKKIQTNEGSEHAIEKNVDLVNNILNTSYSIPTGVVEKNRKYSESLNKKLLNEKISDQDFCIGVVVGARWESKKWPTSFFSKVIDTAHEIKKDAKFIIIGSPDDKDTATEVLSQIKNTTTVSLAGKTNIGELVELIRRCDVILTNDSGPMHISAALDVKTVALFGPTNPTKTGPFGDGNSVIAAEHLDCLRCMKRKCPTGTNKCHTEVCTEKTSKLLTTL